MKSTFFLVPSSPLVISIQQSRTTECLCVTEKTGAVSCFFMSLSFHDFFLVL